jgi:hypothetical protein
VDPTHAPIPRTPAERLLFAQLYQTLLGVSCDGSVAGSLAGSWTVSGDSLVWTFTLRAGASDWNGEAVTANAVGESWLAAAEVLSERPGGEPAPRLVEITALDARTLRARVSEPVEAAWFARPELAVRTSTAGAGWPTGTGSFRPVEPPAASAPPGTPLSSVSLTGPVTLEARAVTGDPRNALETGVDLLLTSEPEVIDYAQAASAFLTAPLAWDRAHVLVTPAGIEADSGQIGIWVSPPSPDGSSANRPYLRVIRPHENVRGSWARDAVPVEARAPADGAFQACMRRSPRVGPAPPATSAAARANPAPPRSRRIVYPANDAVARALAERLIALALDAERLGALARRPGFEHADWVTTMLPDLAAAGSRPAAVGLAPGAFADALEGGADAGYVLATPRSEAVPLCESLAPLAARAPWLAVTHDAASVRPAILTLVDTRSTLVLRRGIVGAAVDGAGVPHLAALRRARPEERP